MDIKDFMQGFIPEERDGDYEPIPEGEYNAVVDSLKIENTDNGSMAKVCYKIKGPTHANRLVFDNCWLTHKNPKANQVGKSKLHKLATVLGLNPETSGKDDYPGLPVNIVLNIEGKYNNVKTVKKHEAAETPAPVASTVNVASDEGGGEW